MIASYFIISCFSAIAVWVRNYENTIEKATAVFWIWPLLFAVYSAKASYRTLRQVFRG